MTKFLLGATALSLMILPLTILPTTAQAAMKLPPPSDAALAVNGNNDDTPAPKALRKRNAHMPLHASRDDDGDRILTPSAPGTALHTAAPVPGNQSGAQGMKATQYND